MAINLNYKPILFDFNFPKYIMNIYTSELSNSVLKRSRSASDLLQVYESLRKKPRMDCQSHRNRTQKAVDDFSVEDKKVGEKVDRLIDNIIEDLSI